MRVPIYCIVFFSCLLWACNSPSSKEEGLKKECEEAYDAMDRIQEKALEDSNFMHSDQYRKEMERAAIEASRRTSGLRANEKLLLEYETAVKLLKEYAEKAAKDASLYQDASFSEKLKVRSDRVREIYVKLKKANLNPLEKRKFDLLSKN